MLQFRLEADPNFQLKMNRALNIERLVHRISLLFFLTARAPASCPALRGKPRDSAHLPLPSMMMAICCGTGSIHDTT